jgi:hypothetical protein
MIYYHATVFWEQIDKEGLVPYDLDERHEHMFEFFDELKLPRKGIWLWPEAVVSEQLFRDFMFFKWSTTKISSTTILRVDVDLDDLLYERYHQLTGDNLHLSHDQDDQHKGLVWHFRVSCDVAVVPIARERLTPVRRIAVRSEKLERCWFPALSRPYELEYERRSREREERAVSDGRWEPGTEKSSYRFIQENGEEYLGKITVGGTNA